MYDPQHPPLLHAQQNDVVGRFPLPFRLQATYRIFKNIIRKLISSGSELIFKFQSITILSRKKPV
jgi:hypothetical protein